MVNCADVMNHSTFADQEVRASNPTWPAGFFGTKFANFAKWFAKHLSSFLVNGLDFEEHLGHEGR